MKTDIRQIKLTSGEEVICEVLDENEMAVVVRNCLSLQKRHGADGTIYHSFNPFMTYQDQPDRAILIVSDKVMSVAIPIPEMISVYRKALDEFDDVSEDDDDDDIDEAPKGVVH